MYAIVFLPERCRKKPKSGATRSRLTRPRRSQTHPFEKPSPQPSPTRRGGIALTPTLSHEERGSGEICEHAELPVPVGHAIAGADAVKEFLPPESLVAILSLSVQLDRLAPLTEEPANHAIG